MAGPLDMHKYLCILCSIIEVEVRRLYLQIGAETDRNGGENRMDKNTWTKPEVEEIDIAERTELDPFSGSDAGANLGRDPNPGGGGGGGGGGS